MAVLVDTSALFALLDVGDRHHREATRFFAELDEPGAARTHNYVLVEAMALVQRRLGMGPTRLLVEDVLPLIDVEWVDESMHAHAVSAFLAGVRRRVSFVDWVSFEMMRRRGIERAFTFDRDFRAQGFETVP